MSQQQQNEIQHGALRIAEALFDNKALLLLNLDVDCFD